MRNLLLVAMVLAVLAAPVLAYTVTQWKTKTLSVAGDVYFTSSISAANGEKIMIEIQPVDTSVTITNVMFKKATPKPKSPGIAGIANVNIAADGKSARLDVNFDGKKTLHLWVYLNTGEHIGVNVKAG